MATINSPQGPGLNGQQGQLGFWYSPLAINVPNFTKDVKTSFQKIEDILKPIIDIQKTTIDIFKPILDLTNRKLDTLTTAVEFVKNLIEPLITDLLDLLRQSGAYILVNVPDVFAKRYIWADSVLNFDSKTGKLTIDRQGGFFSITDVEYAAYSRAQTNVPNASFVGKQRYMGSSTEFLKQQTGLITLKDSKGHPVLIDAKTAQVFSSYGSNGIRGLVDKFNKSFLPLGNAGATSGGNRNDLSIPVFKPGSIVAGMCFMLSYPGFNNFVDSIVALCNLFYPSQDLLKAVSKAKPVLTPVNATDQILKSRKLQVTIEKPNYQPVQGKTTDLINFVSKRFGFIDIIDEKQDHHIKVLVKTANLKPIPFWKVEIFLYVNNLKPNKNGNKTFDYKSAPDALPGAVVSKDGYKKIAAFYSPRLVSLVSHKSLNSDGTTFVEKFETSKFPSDNSSVKILGDVNGDNFGIDFEVPIDFFDAKYNFKVILSSHYNVKISPTYLASQVIQKILDSNKDLEKFIKVDPKTNKSLIDSITGLRIDSFKEYTDNYQFISDAYEIYRTNILKDPRYLSDPSIPVPPSIVPPPGGINDLLDNQAYSVAGHYLADSNLSLEEMRRTEDFQNFLQEVFLLIKHGPNPRFNFWVDELKQKNLKSKMDARLINFNDNFDRVLGKEDKFEVLDQFIESVTPSIFSPSGKNTKVSKKQINTDGTQTLIPNGVSGNLEFKFDRWFSVTISTVFPFLGEFVDAFRKAVHNFKIIFTPLQSPVQNFINGILNELNKIIAIINDVIASIDNILKVLSVLTSEGIQVLRIEDNLGKGYTDGGVDKIKQIILTSAGLPEFLRDDGKLVRAGNTPKGGLQQSALNELAQANAVEQRNQKLTQGEFAGLGIGTEGVSGTTLTGDNFFAGLPGAQTQGFGLQNISATDNIKTLGGSDAFVGMITILAGAPSLQQDVNDLNRAVLGFEKFAGLGNLEVQELQLEDQVINLNAQLFTLDAQRIAVQFELDNLGLFPPVDPKKKSDLTNQLDGIKKQTDTAQKNKTALENQLSVLQQQILGILKNPPPASTNVNTPLQQAQIIATKALFDFIENSILQTPVSKKEALVQQYSAALAKDTGTTP